MPVLFLNSQIIAIGVLMLAMVALAQEETNQPDHTDQPAAGSSLLDTLITKTGGLGGTSNDDGSFFATIVNKKISAATDAVNLIVLKYRLLASLFTEENINSGLQLLRKALNLTARKARLISKHLPEPELQTGHLDSLATLFPKKHLEKKLGLKSALAGLGSLSDVSTSGEDEEASGSTTTPKAPLTTSVAGSSTTPLSTTSFPTSPTPVVGASASGNAATGDLTPSRISIPTNPPATKDDDGKLGIGLNQEMQDQLVKTMVNTMANMSDAELMRLINEFFPRLNAEGFGLIRRAKDTNEVGRNLDELILNQESKLNEIDLLPFESLDEDLEDPYRFAKEGNLLRRKRDLSNAFNLIPSFRQYINGPNFLLRRFDKQQPAPPRYGLEATRSEDFERKSIYELPVGQGNEFRHNSLSPALNQMNHGNSKSVRPQSPGVIREDEYLPEPFPLPFKESFDFCSARVFLHDVSTKMDFQKCNFPTQVQPDFFDAVPVDDNTLIYGLPLLVN